MFRLWAKQFKNNRLVNDMVISDGELDTRTHKVLRALETACYEFDLEQPIWLDSTVRDFQRHAKARFNRDHFIEEIDFD